MDNCRVILDYIAGGRLNFKPIIGEIQNPKNAGAVYNRLAFDKKFPIGVVFDWELIKEEKT